ncbi:MAG: xanthine dehydrogenase accessory protein XdhC [Sphingomonas sp.]|nr:xanthine dehydrogenase accessory protein XdhC [Sphingomonas sp.]
MSTERWEAAAKAAIDAGEPAALVSILATEGSAPRGAGTRMLVTAHGIAGTIGGGALEHQAIAQARALLDHPAGSWRVQDYPLGPLLGQCCGGRVRLLVERLAPQARDWIEQSGVLVTRFEADALIRTIENSGLMVASLSARGPRPSPGDRIVERLGTEKRPVLLFGAGHVGRAVARAVDGLPLALSWFDTRPDAGETPGVALVEDVHIESCARDAPPGAALLIMTHDHGLDYRLTAAALHSPARFVGLIGSATKRARFLSRLERDGFDATDRARLICPIGVEGVTGKAPEVIAIAVAAQLLRLHGAAA